MILVPRALDRWTERPAWKPWIEGAAAKALIMCPNGHLATLHDHDIGADGTVTPSVVCPTAGCGWHENVRLGGWPP